MWQRIQTLYLVLAAVLLAVLFSGDAVTVNTADGLEGIRYTSLAKPYMLILLIVLALGNALALIAFKVRILQMRLSVICGLLALGMEAWLAVMYFTAPEGMVFRWTAIFPLAGAILYSLAARGAFQDQLIVESAYRIRDSRRGGKR